MDKTLISIWQELPVHKSGKFFELFAFAPACPSYSAYSAYRQAAGKRQANRRQAGKTMDVSNNYHSRFYVL
ncbi:MAG: hypothetical protein U9M90_00260 [Patescibacteria group bacterium]|nr:hypothetical protein [Patescibacteria group bacterium]